MGKLKKWFKGLFDKCAHEWHDTGQPAFPLLVDGDKHVCVCPDCLKTEIIHVSVFEDYDVIPFNSKDNVFRGGKA